MQIGVAVSVLVFLKISLVDCGSALDNLMVLLNSIQVVVTIKQQFRM